MKRLLLVLAVSLVACGGEDEPTQGNPPPSAPDFSGTWRGIASVSGSCSDNSVINSSQDLQVVVSQNGSEVSFASTGACGIMEATANGSTATLKPKSCQPQVSSAGTFQDSIASGTARLDTATRMHVSVRFNNVWQDSAGNHGTCDYTESGDLTK